MKSYLSFSFSFNGLLKLFYCLENASKLLVVFSFKHLNLFLNVFMGEDIFSKFRKCPDNLYIYMNSFFAIQNT